MFLELLEDGRKGALARPTIEVVPACRRDRLRLELVIDELRGPGGRG